MNYLNNIKKIHFIGIGGVSMNAIALCLANMGYTVSGSDRNSSVITEILIKNNIKIFIGQVKENIENPDLVVYTAAIQCDNEELIAAKDKQITCIERAVLLGELLKLYKKPVGVSGTHGKTTVTSMISAIALEAQTDPTIMVGGTLPQINGNLRIGKSENIIFESCEYSNSFLNFNPFISVILNIEADHLDFFKDINDIILSFSKYVDNTKPNGVIIANAEDENIGKALIGYKGNVITFGIDKGDYTATNIHTNGVTTEVTVNYNKQEITNISLKVFGVHNIKNVLAAFVASREMGISVDNIKLALEKFSGAKRRFEVCKVVRDITIIDDYAHHPTEIQASLLTAKEICKGKVIAAFQPHTYSRTKALTEDFAKALSLADVVILAPVFAAREVNVYGVSSLDIVNKIENAKYIENLEDIAKEIMRVAKPNDMVISMGAGDICKICELIN